MCGFPAFTCNDINLITGSVSDSHNGIFRSKDLGTITSLNEYIAFRQAHGLDDNSYKDLYLGDYFKIQDGTYNAVWMVAHFDYYFHKGNGTGGGLPTGSNPKGVVLIPKTALASSYKMNNTATTEGGYANTIMHKVTLPAVASALQTVLGSYLQTRYEMISSAVNTSMMTAAGLGLYGSVTAQTNTAILCALPTECQIYGHSHYASSPRATSDNSFTQLAVFKFIGHTRYEQRGTLCADVANTTAFCYANSLGETNLVDANSEYPIRPIIYIK